MIRKNIYSLYAAPLAVAAFLCFPASVSASETEASQDTVVVATETIYAPAYSTPTAQKAPSWWKQIRVNGAIQTEFHFPLKDDLTANQGYSDRPVLNNTYFDLTVSAPYLSLGGRFEFAKWPLPAFYDTPGYAGWGVPYMWATGRYEWAQITAGDFYEQFGSGLILRAYNERNMGIDNAIRGGRLKLNPVSGLYLTALGGVQRYYWTHNPAFIWGGDADWSIDETFSKAFNYNYGVNVGFSYVGTSQYQTNYYLWDADQLMRLRFPETVAAFDYRLKLRLHDFNILAEGAYKSQDPSAYNNFTYGDGHAELFTLSYAKKGTSAFVQAKRSENMRFQSDRMQNDLQGNGNINHLPAFSMTQTYTLAALYSYATQYDGEWAFQGEFGHLFPKGSPLGGKYGTNVRLSASYISGLGGMPSVALQKAPEGSNGYHPAYWKIGKLYYADANLEIKKKLTKDFQLTLFYLFQKFDLYILQGHGGMMTTNVAVLEGQWKMAKKAQMRWELQYLATNKDEGDWMGALVEVSFAPHWMITLSDTYNNSRRVDGEWLSSRRNYYKGMVTYTYKANRFSLAYGRTRSGYDCSGGVCRLVPATNGISFTYNYTF